MANYNNIQLQWAVNNPPPSKTIACNPLHTVVINTPVVILDISQGKPAITIGSFIVQHITARNCNSAVVLEGLDGVTANVFVDDASLSQTI